MNLNEAGKEFYKTPIFLGNLKLYLGTSCKNCPPDFEFWNWQHAQPRQGQCRSSNPKMDCCRICRPNYFSTDGKECVRVKDHMATDKPFGATKEFECKLTDQKQLVYCNPQGHCSATNQGGWRACRPCYGTKEGVFYGTTKNTECKNCQKNEYSDNGSCKLCSTCEGLLQTESLANIYSIAETDTDYPFIYKIAPTTELTWKMDVIAAACYQLERRHIKPQTEIINSIDMYSIAQLSRIDPVPDFYTIVQIDNTCSLKRCDTLCTEFFQHSPGCREDGSCVMAPCIVGAPRAGATARCGLNNPISELHRCGLNNPISELWCAPDGFAVRQRRGGTQGACNAGRRAPRRPSAGVDVASITPSARCRDPGGSAACASPCPRASEWSPVKFGQRCVQRCKLPWRPRNFARPACGPRRVRCCGRAHALD